jgi:hypothetical protein
MGKATLISNIDINKIYHYRQSRLAEKERRATPQVGDNLR